MTVHIAMSKAHIDGVACGGAVQPLTKNKLGHFKLSQLEGAEAISLFAKAGDMVLSSQKGAHCGHPQHPEAKRAVLVNMYQR
jgi:hypothetical protein